MVFCPGNNPWFPSIIGMRNGMISLSRQALLGWVALTFIGCSKPASPTAAQTVGDVVTNLVARAEAGDTNYLVAFLDETAKGSVPQLIEMIRRSGMLTNHPGRLRKDSLSQARLDYHDPEAGCHFQVDLQQEGPDWKVRRIYFCR